MTDDQGALFDPPPREKLRPHQRGVKGKPIDWSIPGKLGDARSIKTVEFVAGRPEGCAYGDVPESIRVDRERWRDLIRTGLLEAVDADTRLLRVTPAGQKAIEKR